MKSNKILITSIILVLTIITFATVISALGVSVPFMENKELKVLSDAEPFDFKFVLQSGEGKDINVRADITKGSEIIKLTDSSNIYFVKEGDKVNVNTKITIPEQAKIGDVYEIEVTFATSPVQELGQFAFGSSIKQIFDIVIVEETLEQAPEKENEILSSNYIYYLIGAIVVVAIIIFFILKKKKKKFRR